MITWHVYPDGVHVWKDGVFVGVIHERQIDHLMKACAEQRIAAASANKIP